MTSLLDNVLEAHGGLDRWKSFERVDATIVNGGGFFALKGVLQDAEPRQMTAWLHEEKSSVLPFGALDQRAMFTPDRDRDRKAGRNGPCGALCSQGFVRRPPDAHAMGSAPPRLFQW